MQNAMGRLKEQGQAAEAMAALLSSALCEMLQKHQGNNSSAEIQLAQATLRLKLLLKNIEACQAAQLAAVLDSDITQATAALLQLQCAMKQLKMIYDLVEHMDGELLTRLVTQLLEKEA